MAQVNAGDIIALVIDGDTIRVKVEDASKSESISGKVVSSASNHYTVDSVYDFSRQLLTR